MKKILVIDDELGVVQLIKARLEASGYGVISASDGEEGLNLLKDHQPDLIILDIQMPKMDGFTFVREFKRVENIKNTPVIVLTAKEKLQDIFKMEGIKDYVVKPFNTSDLLDRIKKYIG